MLSELFKKEYVSYSDDTIDILRLIRTQNVGPKTFMHLVRLFGSASNALEHVAELSLKGGKERPITVTPKSDVEKELDLLRLHNGYIIDYKNPAYPKLLKQIDDFPPIIICKGNVELMNKTKMVAVVGARNASYNSLFFTKKITVELVNNGFVTVSGLARGVDKVVHENSLGHTIGVVAGGIDYIYPEENRDLFEKLGSNSLIISEFPIGVKPLPKHFPQRNRIISGLSLGTIVVQASLKSGSLITAKFALEQNREVFSVPGFPLDARCAGTNKLIKDGAILFESVDDIFNNLNFQYKFDMNKSDGNNLENFHANNNNYELPSAKSIYSDISDNDRKRVIDLLSSSPINYEHIASLTGFTVPVVYAICLELELAGKIVRCSGNNISLKYSEA